MKEAAGEANMTVITIVLIGLVAAAGAVLIPNLLDNMQKTSVCNNLGGKRTGDSCAYPNTSGGTSTCNISKDNTGKYKCG